jgi:hypothetical protein
VVSKHEHAFVGHVIGPKCRGLAIGRGRFLNWCELRYPLHSTVPPPFASRLKSVIDPYCGIAA